jgi:hypothetical protein
MVVEILLVLDLIFWYFFHLYQPITDIQKGIVLQLQVLTRAGTKRLNNYQKTYKINRYKLGDTLFEVLCDSGPLSLQENFLQLLSTVCTIVPMTYIRI